MDKQTDQNVFVFSNPTVAPAVEGAKSRSFTGVAYSGDKISGHYYWGDVVFDLETMSLPAKLPALLDHDVSQRCGFVTEHSKGADGLKVNGKLLNNQYGKDIASDSDDGFPWQMSVRIDPSRIEELMVGASTVVNGRTFAGPITVFRDSTLREVSFTPMGWDSQTSATAMSRGAPQGATSMTPEQIAAMQAENTRLAAENTKLTADLGAAVEAKTTAETALTSFSKAARTEQVKSLFADLGKEFKEDAPEVLAFTVMDAAGFSAAASLLRDAKKAALPETLFSHQAQAGQPAPAAEINPLLADAQARAAAHTGTR